MTINEQLKQKARAEKKIDKFKQKMQKLSNKLTEDIHGICENLDYQNSSRFSYNVDRLLLLNTEVQDFTII